MHVYHPHLNLDTQDIITYYFVITSTNMSISHIILPKTSKIAVVL